MYYVYILLCFDGLYYTGMTGGLKKRLVEHQSGLVISTKYRLPVKLKYYCCFPTQNLAVKFEKYLKSNSGRSFRNKHFLNLTQTTSRQKTACTA